MLCDYITDGRVPPWDQNAVCIYKTSEVEFYVGSCTLLRVVNGSHTNVQDRKYHVVFLRCYDNSSTVYDNEIRHDTLRLVLFAGINFSDLRK